MEKGKTKRLTIGLIIALVLILPESVVAACRQAFVKNTPVYLTAIKTIYAQVKSDKVTIRWFGHSSFLITSLKGTKIITDPNYSVTEPMLVDAITVSNMHPTHNNTGAFPGSPIILNGISSSGLWNKIDRTVKDIHVLNVPSNRGISDNRMSFINSIFLFIVDEICIAHLGNINHILTEEQLTSIGKVDVLMIPIDGQVTLNYGDVITVIKQLKPSIVLPMHYDIMSHVDLFLTFLKDRYPVKKIFETILTLDKSILPERTEIYVFIKD